MGQRLRIVRKKRGMTIDELAETSGLSQSFLSRVERGERTLSMPALNDVAKALACEPGELLSGALPGGPPESMPLVQVQVIGAVQAGLWREALEWPAEDRYSVTVPLNPRFGQKRSLFALQVGGPSMDELYPDGSVVICVSLLDWGRDPEPGDKVVVHRRDATTGEYEATVKEIRRHPDGSWWLWPRSTHPEFQQPWRLPDANGDDNGGLEDLRITAIVTSSLRFER